MLNVLLQPVEDEDVTIGFAYGSFTFPDSFPLLRSMNS